MIPRRQIALLLLPVVLCLGPALEARGQTSRPGVEPGAGVSLAALMQDARRMEAQRNGPTTAQAALASLVLPGAGQIWSGRKWGWGLVAAEGLLVGSALWARSEGRERQGGYEDFADRYWDQQRYVDYLTSYQVATGTPWPHNHHTLPPVGVRNHDYYEMIGKYNQFAPGWDDWSPDAGSLVDGTSLHRSRYVDARWRANRYLKWTLTAGGLVFLNHALASVEALIWGRRTESRQVSLGLRPERTRSARSLLLTITWRPKR